MTTSSKKQGIGRMFAEKAPVVRYLLVTSGIMRDPIVFLVIFSSLSRAGLMFSINETAKTAEQGVGWSAVWIGVSAALMLAFGYVLKMRTHVLIERIRKKTRIRLTKTLTRADIDFLLSSPHGRVHQAITHEVDNLSGAINTVIGAVEATVIILFAVPYLFWISWETGMATVGAMVIGALGYQFFDRPARTRLHRASQDRAAYWDRVRDLLSGWKELRLRQSRRAALESETLEIIENTSRHTIDAERMFAASTALGQTAVILLLCFVVILLPVLPGGSVALMFQVLTIIFLTNGPIEYFFGALPILASAENSFNRIHEVEEALTHAQSASIDSDQPAPTSFKEVRLENISASVSEPGREDAETFHLGPVDLTFSPGETIFICGGNGSGKTTLLDIITGLRRPDQGEIYLDGAPLDDQSRHTYRELFSSVFSGFYLFPRAYGLSPEEIERMERRIADLNLSDRVNMHEDRFSSLSLSAGQKRRLALSLALAEQRPIIVLDEFAADQDPANRAFFYDVLVPELAASGQLVIAITHDEHQFHKCDRLIRMEAGRVVQDQRQDHPATQVSG